MGITLPTLLRLMAEQQLPLCVDSRKATPGCVFSVLTESEHSNAHVADAVKRGAAIVVRTTGSAHAADAETLHVDAPRLITAQLAAARHNTMALPFPLIGVTGTNGKTTVTYLLDHLFHSMGKQSGVIGTIAARWPGYENAAAMTTPDSPDLHSMLAAMTEAKVEAAAMEVSSHALDQDRVAYVPYSGAVFTNLTQDHLDYHKTYDAYYAAKARLFFDLPHANKVMAIGVDGAWGKKLAMHVAERFSAPNLITYGLTPWPDAPQKARHMHGTLLESSTKGMRLNITVDGKQWEMTSPLVGAYNAENLLAVQAVGTGLGFTPDQLDCFSTFNGVPGRLERIANPHGLDVFVDYAHTPDALTNVLTALRGAGFTRILCVFGCGGNRDRTKRPLMGEAVAHEADVAILTSDNPRHEDPNAIMADVLPGLSEAKHVVTEPDRREALRKALALLQPGDALLVAGKGHERTQQIGDVKHPFSDQQTLRELMHVSER